MTWPTWQTLENYIVARAHTYSVNPRLAVRIAQLESGSGHSMIGDDRSSFGPYQLHYGGISRRFPHGGLGDIFTHQTGLHAQNSGSWQAQVDFAIRCLAHGDGPQWSTYRQAAGRGARVNTHLRRPQQKHRRR